MCALVFIFPLQTHRKVTSKFIYLIESVLVLLVFSKNAILLLNFKYTNQFQFQLIWICLKISQSYALLAVSNS